VHFTRPQPPRKQRQPALTRWSAGSAKADLWPGARLCSPRAGGIMA